MIDGVGKTAPGQVGAVRTDQTAPAAPVVPIRPQGQQGAVESAVFGLVSNGAPVDSAKVAAIRAAIAEGRYPVDADKIAARMVELDLPARG